MSIFKLFTIAILFSTLLFSTTYENASSKSTKKWHVLKEFSNGKIKNIYDKYKKSRVIQFKGDGTKSVYILTPKKKSFKKKKNETIFEWEMNFKEDFVIMIGMYTVKGKRYLIYTSGENNSYLQYGLGSDSTSGKWKKYSRDLQKDLEYFDKYNKLISVSSFVVKGSGRVDNIRMIKSKKVVKKEKMIKIEKNTTIKKSPKVEKKIEAKIEEKNNKIETNRPPVIHIKGDNPIFLKNGERYKELGATANDSYGSKLKVIISQDIDIFKDGEYSVIYMATDNNGNSALDRRVVRVGNVPKETKQPIISDSVDNNKEEEIVQREDDDVDLQQRALEILDWEKQLASREQELENKKNINYPSRPGL